ncbi:MAG: MaoC family dehydratase [Candidatus Paceibacterota bacterium]
MNKTKNYVSYAPEFLEQSRINLSINVTADEIAVGDKYSIKRFFTTQDIIMFAAVSGDLNPIHLDEAYAEGTRFKRPIVHGAFVMSLFSKLMGTEFPGLGTILIKQSLEFKAPVYIGDTITAIVECVEKKGKAQLTMKCSAINEKGSEVISGTTIILAPRVKIVREPFKLPRVAIKQ